MAENPLFKPAVPLLRSRGFKKRGGAQIFAKSLAPAINAWLGVVDYEAYAARLAAEIDASPTS